MRNVGDEAEYANECLAVNSCLRYLRTIFERPWLCQGTAIRNSWSIRPFVVFMYVATELRRLRHGAFCHILHNMRVLRLSTCRSPNITASARWEDIFRFRCSPVRLFKRVTHPYTPQASHVRILRHKHAPRCSSNRPISYVSSQSLPISYF